VVMPAGRMGVREGGEPMEPEQQPGEPVPVAMPVPAEE
jgi:hypothetical protein